MDHDCDPFCQACYSRLFKPKGYGCGASTFSTDYGSPVSEQPKVDGTELQAFKVVFPSPKSDSCVCIIKDGSRSDSAAKEILASSSADSTIVVEISASGSVASPPVVEKKSSGQVRLPINAGPKCPVCQKTVYKMEELNAVGRIWHTNCFTCGGGKADTEG